jgi:hypothetical protein
MRILASVLVRLPLILAGLLPVVSLGGVLTMHDAATVGYAPPSGHGIGTPIATDCERAVIGAGTCLDELDERTSPVGAADGGAGSVGGPGDGAASSTPDLGEGNVAGAPGKSEEANGDAIPSGSGNGAGQQRVDESGEGPLKAEDDGVAEGKDRQGPPSEP